MQGKNLTHADPSRASVAFTAEGIKRSLDEFFSHVENLVNGNQERAVGLALGSAVLLREFAENKLILKEGVTPTAVASTLLAALRLVDGADFPLTDDRQNFSCYRDEALRLSVEAEGLTQPNMEEEERTKDGQLQYFASMLDSAHVMQGDTGPRIANALIITGLSGFRNLPAAPADSDNLFREAFGLD